MNAIKPMIHNEWLYIRFGSSNNIMDVINAKNDSDCYQYTARSIALVICFSHNSLKICLRKIIIKAMGIEQEATNEKRSIVLFERIKNIIAYLVYFLDIEDIIETVFFSGCTSKAQRFKQFKQWLPKDDIARSISLVDLVRFKDTCNQSKFIIEQEDILESRKQVKIIKKCLQVIKCFDRTPNSLVSILKDISDAVQNDATLMAVVMVQFLMYLVGLSPAKAINECLSSAILNKGNIWIACEIIKYIPYVMELMANKDLPEGLLMRLKSVDNVCKNPCEYCKEIKNKPAEYAKRSSDFFSEMVQYNNGRMVLIDLVINIKIKYFGEAVYLNTKKFDKVIKIIHAKNRNGSYKYTARSIAMNVACISKDTRNRFLKRLLKHTFVHKQKSNNQKHLVLFTRYQSIVAYMVYFLNLEGAVFQVFPKVIFNKQYKFKEFISRLFPPDLVSTITKEDFEKFISECGCYEISEKHDVVGKKRIEKLKAYVHIIWNLDKPGSPLLEKFRRDLTEDPQLIAIVVAHVIVCFGRMNTEMMVLKLYLGNELIKDENTHLRLLILRHCCYVIKLMQAQLAPKDYVRRIHEIISLCLIPEKYCSTNNRDVAHCIDLTDGSLMASNDDSANATLSNRKRQNDAQSRYLSQKRARRSGLNEFASISQMTLIGHSAESINKSANINFGEEEQTAEAIINDGSWDRCIDSLDVEPYEKNNAPVAAPSQSSSATLWRQAGLQLLNDVCGDSNDDHDAGFETFRQALNMLSS